MREFIVCYLLSANRVGVTFCITMPCNSPAWNSAVRLQVATQHGYVKHQDKVMISGKCTNSSSSDSQGHDRKTKVTKA